MGARYADRTPQHTLIHHYTPPYTTIHHHTTLHHRAPPHTFTGYHWFHAVATIFDVCIDVIIHHHNSIYTFGDPSKSRIRLYQKDEGRHYDALVAAVPGSVAESPEAFVSAADNDNASDSSSSASVICNTPGAAAALCGMYMVVYVDVRWCMVVYGARWCAVVYSGVRWCMVVLAWK